MRGEEEGKGREGGGEGREGREEEGEIANVYTFLASKRLVLDSCTLTSGIVRV